MKDDTEEYEAAKLAYQATINALHPLLKPEILGNPDKFTGFLGGFLQAASDILMSLGTSPMSGIYRATLEKEGEEAAVRKAKALLEEFQDVVLDRLETKLDKLGRLFLADIKAVLEAKPKDGEQSVYIGIKEGSLAVASVDTLRHVADLWDANRAKKKQGGEN